MNTYNLMKVKLSGVQQSFDFDSTWISQFGHWLVLLQIRQPVSCLTSGSFCVLNVLFRASVPTALWEFFAKLQPEHLV
jgi:hypothetical protein